MNIGDVAEKTGLPAKTIRYYEQIALIQPHRRDNGYREFSETDIHKLAFLSRARALGFSIPDCRMLLGLYEDETRESAQVKSIAQEHLAAIDEKLTQLYSMRETLSALVDACHGDARPDCPILKDLSSKALPGV